MSPAGRTLRKSANGKLIPAVILLLFSPASAATDHEGAETLRHLKQEAESLVYLKQLYGSEIFDYCLKEHGANLYLVAGCTERQQVRKERLFQNGQARRGRRSLVQAIYDDCVDYYPDRGVARIGSCVDARLKLRDKLDNEPVEREIYDRCDKKWARHGPRAITACSIHAANYYRREGQLRD